MSIEYEIKLDIKEDYMFKKVFGDRDNNPILISFLNAVLNKKPLIKSVKMLNTELARDFPDTKTVVLDIQAQLEDGTYLDIELQKSYAVDLLNRFLLYGAKQLCKHTIKGKNAPPLNKEHKIISIWILDCKVKGLEVFQEDLPIGNFCYTTERDPLKKVITPKFTIIPIELPKIKKYKNITPELISWLQFFKYSQDISNPIEIEEIHEAYEKMKSIGGDKVYINYLEAREKYEINKYSEIYCAREEGLKEGIKEGEHKKMKELAVNMKKQGFDDKLIAKCLNIDINALQALLNNNLIK